MLPPPSLSMSPVSISCKPGLDSVGFYSDGARTWTLGRAGFPGADDTRHTVLAELQRGSWTPTIALVPGAEA